MMRAASRCALAVLLVLGATACGDENESGDALVVDGPLLAWDGDATADGMDAQVAGTLRLEDDCLLLSADGGTSAVMWPAGTTWDDGRQVVVLSDGTDVALGDRITSGGGYIQLGSDAIPASSAAEPLAGCAPTTGDVAVIDVDGEVEVEG